MAKRIRSINDLPQWFNIRNYDKAAHLDLVGWEKQLSFRGVLTYLLEKTEKSDQERKEIIELYLNRIKDDPIIPPGKAKVRFGCKSEWLLALWWERRADEGSPIIDAFWMWQLASNWPDLFSAGETKAESLDSIIIKHGINLDYLPPVHQYFKIGLGDQTPVLIDLARSDAEILIGVQTWLSRKRLRHIERHWEEFTETHFARWHKMRVLAYMDLDFWSMTEGLKINHETMGEALFSNDIVDEDKAEIDLGERVRRTVRRDLVKPLRDIDTLIRLAQQVEREQAASLEK